MWFINIKYKSEILYSISRKIIYKYNQIENLY